MTKAYQYTRHDAGHCMGVLLSHNKNNMQNKVQDALKAFIYKERPDGTHYWYLSDNAPEGLQDSVREAHGGRLPSDWHFEIYHDCLEKISAYDVDSVERMQDLGYHLEIADSLVNVYTSDLTNWLNSHNDNVYYLSEALADGSVSDGFEALSRAQYLAIDEIMQEVISYLSK